MGCGCSSGKNTKQVPGVTQSTVRFTVYQVLKENEVVSEFSNLREARAAAVEVGGRVKVTSKMK